MHMQAAVSWLEQGNARDVALAEQALEAVQEAHTPRSHTSTSDQAFPGPASPLSFARLAMSMHTGLGFRV